MFHMFQVHMFVNLKKRLKKLNVNSTPAAESTCPSLRGRWALAPQNPEHVYYLCSLSGSAKILCLLCLFILYCNWGERKWRRKDYIWSDTKVLFQWGIRTVMFFYMEFCVCVCVHLCLCVDQNVVRWRNFLGLRLSPPFFLMTVPQYLFRQPDISPKDQTTLSHTSSNPPTYNFTATV